MANSPIANFDSQSFGRGTQKTAIVILTFFAVHVVLNLSEITLHVFFKDDLAIWLRASSGLTATVANYIPAVDNVFVFVSHTPYADRAYFLQNIIAMNWAIMILYLIFVPIIFTIEVLSNTAPFMRLWGYVRFDFSFERIDALAWPFGGLFRSIRKNDFLFFIFPLLMTAESVGVIFTGWIVTGGPIFNLSSNDTKILLILISFIFAEMMIYGVLVGSATLFLRVANNKSPSNP